MCVYMLESCILNSFMKSDIFLYNQATSTEKKTTYKIKFLSDFVKNCIISYLNIYYACFQCFCTFFCFIVFMPNFFQCFSVCWINAKNEKTKKRLLKLLLFGFEFAFIYLLPFFKVN